MSAVTPQEFARLGSAVARLYPREAEQIWWRCYWAADDDQRADMERGALGGAGL